MVGMYLIITYLDNIRYFTHPKIPSELVVYYILNVIPEILIKVIPSAALFSASYIFGNMNSSNEIIAIYNGKIGFTRLISPLIISGIIISILLFIFFEFVSAESSSRAVEIRNSFRKITGGSSRSMYNNEKFFFKGSNNVYYFIEYFNFENKTMIKPSIFLFNSNDEMIFQLNAESAIFLEKEKHWMFSNANIIHYNGKENYKNEIKQTYSMNLAETPINFINTPVNVMQMRMNDAINFIEAKRKSGADYKKFLVEFHMRFVFPISVIITILIGSIAGIFFRKSVLVLSFFLAIVISFGYYGILAICIALGKSGKLAPIVAAWAANIIYFSMAVLALKFKK